MEQWFRYEMGTYQQLLHEVHICGIDGRLSSDGWAAAGYVPFEAILQVVRAWLPIEGDVLIYGFTDLTEATRKSRWSLIACSATSPRLFARLVKVMPSPIFSSAESISVGSKPESPSWSTARRT